MGASIEDGSTEKARELVSLSDADEDGNLQWTAKEEASLVRRIDFILIPLLTLGFFALQLDRGNIGYALNDNFLDDVGITQDQFNIGSQLLSLGIVLLEIPSNLVLYKVGPAVWINAQIVAWGLVALFQAFQHGLGAHLATRILLGFCEAGFIPAALYTLGEWYTKEELGKRFSWFFMGNLVANGTTGLIAFGILPMRGISGLAGWQWMFIIEGLLTIAIGIAMFIGIPNSPTNPVSLARIRYFSEQESRILVERVLRDDPNKAIKHRTIAWRDVKAVLTNWRLLPHFVMTLCGLAPAHTFGNYAPSLVRSFGFEAIRANALTSVGYWGLMLMILFWGWLADRIQVRGVLVTLGFALGLVFYIADRAAIYADSAKLRFALLTVSIAFSWQWHPTNGVWLSLNTKSPTERSITMAIHIMSANCAGLIGSQLFRADDAPYYPRGWTVIVALSATAVVLSVVANLQYYIGNGRKLKRSGLRFAY